VAPDCWIRLDEKLGLVIDTQQSGGGLGGHFMVKQDGMWHRLALKPE
jgi:hypothetical protein